MFNIAKVLSTAFVSFVLASSFAHAQPINFTYQGIADFSINGTSSSNVAFEISADADSSNVTPNVFNPSLLFLNHDSTTIDLGALGLFSIDDPTSTFVNQSTGVLGLGDANAGFTEFSLVADPAFNSYDLASSFGPLSLAVDTNSAFFSVSDAMGSSTLSIDDFVGPVTFTASVGSTAIPEPTAFCMIALGCIGLTTTRRRTL
jgi:hypothetical protein